MLSKIIENILLTLSIFQYLSSLYFQRTMYKDSAVSIARKRRRIPTSDGNYYLFEDNDGGGKMPENNKGNLSQPIESNNKNNKEKKRKRGVQLSLISAVVEKVDKAKFL